MLWILLHRCRRTAACVSQSRRSTCWRPGTSPTCVTRTRSRTSCATWWPPPDRLDARYITHCYSNHTALEWCLAPTLVKQIQGKARRPRKGLENPPRYGLVLPWASGEVVKARHFPWHNQVVKAPHGLWHTEILEVTICYSISQIGCAYTAL